MLLLSVILAFSAVACGGGGGQDDSISYFYLKSSNSGTGSLGLKVLVQKFQEEYADYHFAPGKTGVVVELDAKGSTYFVDSMDSEAYHGYIQPYGVDASQISKGTYLCLEDIFNEVNPYDNKTIKSKMPEFTRYLTSGTSANQNGGKEGVYIAPNMQYYGGLTYDKNCFDKNGLYFTASDYNGLDEENAIIDILDPLGNKTYDFVVDTSDLYEEAVKNPDGTFKTHEEGWNSNHYLSCGPDGIYETFDDGMPSSLEELIAVCAYMRGKGIYPFVLSGDVQNNQHSCEAPMVNSLLGEHEETMRSFEGKDFEVVTGYKSNSELWGMADVQEPITAKVDVTESCGYYTTWSTARYYTTAFWKLAVKHDWYTKTVATNTSHLAAEADFIFSGYDTAEREVGAFMCDASYWITESREQLNFEDFNKKKYQDEFGNVITGEDREEQLIWLSLPRQIFGTVEEGNGSPEIMMVLTRNVGDVYNAVYTDSEEDMELIRQWLFFYYSDESMNILTAYCNGLTLPMDYEVDTTAECFNGRPFAKNFHNRLKNAVKSDDSSTTMSFLLFPNDFYFHYWDDCWMGVGNERAYNLYMAYTQGGYSVHKAFEERLIGFESWGSFFDTHKGANADAPTVAKDKNGNDVHYTKHP